MGFAKKYRKTIIFMFLLIGCLIGLCYFSLHSLLEIPEIICLKDNLDFVGKIIARYPWLATIVVLLIILLLLIQNFSITSPTMKLFGIEFQMKHTEQNVKIQIKNYLSSKRAVFVLYEEYDNYYDVINSMYEILLFLRKQLANFEHFSQTDTECYKQIEAMIKAIGCFLTKYQSDYRRYYEMQMSVESELFVSFKEIQTNYSEVMNMKKDFLKLNNEMNQYADYFKIDIDKWRNWYIDKELEESE